MPGTASSSPSLAARARAALEAIRARAVAATIRWAPTESQRVFGLTLVVGAACGLVAVAFHVAIAKAQALVIEPLAALGGVLGGLGLVVAPALGGLVAGVMLHTLTPAARGSGIPQVKVAYAVDTRRVRLRDAIGKFAACTLQIGSGASLGREGPTVFICSAVAAAFGRWLALSPANLRRLIPVGAAAGIAAAFNAPIAAVTFTIEEIVGTLDQTVLSGVVVAAALAAVVEHSVLGTNPVFEAPHGAGLHHASSIPFYAGLGVAAALLSVVFLELLLRTRANVARQRWLPSWGAPALGGAVTGLLAAAGLLLVSETGIAGAGFTTFGRALHGDLALHVLLFLCVAKLLATVSSYGSGGAGGIFAPVLFIGAMLGGGVGALDVAVLGHPEAQELSSFALVGMGALFAAVIRAPITSVLIVFEMTGNYNLVVPLMIANSVAYFLARRLRPVAIYDALLAQDGITLPHGHEAHAALAKLDVAGAMTTSLVTLPASITVVEAAKEAARHGFATYPIADDAGAFVGLLSEARMQRLIAEGGGEGTTGESARRKEYATPDEPLLRAVARMNRLGVRQLPVLERRTHALVGMLAMSDVLRAQALFAEAHGLGGERTSLTPSTPGERPSVETTEAPREGAPEPPSTESQTS